MGYGVLKVSSSCNVRNYKIVKGYVTVLHCCLFAPALLELLEQCHRATPL